MFSNSTKAEGLSLIFRWWELLVMQSAMECHKMLHYRRNSRSSKNTLRTCNKRGLESLLMWLTNFLTHLRNNRSNSSRSNNHSCYQLSFRPLKRQRMKVPGQELRCKLPNRQQQTINTKASCSRSVFRVDDISLRSTLPE